MLNSSRADIDAAVRWALEAGHLSVAGAITGAVELCPHWIPDIELSDLIIDTAQRCANISGARSALALAAGGCALADRGELDRSQQFARVALELAETPAERFLACMSLGVAAIYAGAHEESTRWWREIGRMESLPLAYQAEGHISLALLACYHDDLHTARREAAHGLAAAEASGSVAVHAFALYTAGETTLKDDAARGLRILGGAAEKANVAGAAHVSQVARLAQFGALVRLGRHDEALALVAPLLHDERRAGAWPQLWTTVRILAELLAAQGRAQDAAFLLAAADNSESAPHVTGEDVPRYGQLTRDLRERLGGELVDRIAVLAKGIPRAQVLDRVLALLGELAQ